MFSTNLSDMLILLYQEFNFPRVTLASKERGCRLYILAAKTTPLNCTMPPDETNHFPVKQNGMTGPGQELHLACCLFL